MQMKNIPGGVAIFISFLCLSSTAKFSANDRSNPDSYQRFISIDTIAKDGYTLIFINKDSAFDLKVKQRMIDAFFTVYPKQTRRFNPGALQNVTFIIDTAYKGVAGTSNGIVRYNPKWFHDHPGDIDVVTHEVMHIVQAYPAGSGPGWLTEGIADYARYIYGVDNAGGGWSLTPFSSSHRYTNSYRITARFLVWLEKNISPRIVDDLDTAMRSKTYSQDTWKQLTGKTVDELWEAYSLRPEI